MQLVALRIAPGLNQRITACQAYHNGRIIQYRGVLPLAQDDRKINAINVVLNSFTIYEEKKICRKYRIEPTTHGIKAQNPPTFPLHQIDLLNAVR